MNGYYFTASTTCAQIRPVTNRRGQSAEELQIWSGCNTAVVCAETADEAQKLFKEWLCAQTAGEKPRETKIHDIMAAQLVGELLTEQGADPLDWPHIVRQTRLDVESTPPDFLEQGNWLDEGTLNKIDGSRPSLDRFGMTLPEDIRSGLNWSAAKQFYFLIIVLSPLKAPSEQMEAPEAGLTEDVEAVEEVAGESQFGRYMEAESYPKLTPMETAVLIRGRNSAAAAWRWRRYAADTRLAGNPIRLEVWYGVLGVKVEPPSDGN